LQVIQEFELSFPPDDAYERLLDIEHVVPCMPGAQLGARRDDGSYEVTVTTKLGPMRFTYAGDIRIVDVDRERRSAVLKGSAREQRGQGQAEATIEMVVSGEQAPARVRAVADIALTGRAAQMGHGVIEPVAGQLIAQMAAELERRAAETPSETPASGRVANASAAEPAATGGTTAAVAAEAAARAPARGHELKGGRFAFKVFVRWLRGLFGRRRDPGESSSR
jgi:carbon monoxide dehydrogenase subunit G